MRLYRRADEILHYVWDPIGIAGEPGARDEYEGYLGRVFTLLNEGKTAEDICRYLDEVASMRMGLTLTASSQVHTLRAVEKILAWKKHLSVSEGSRHRPDGGAA